MEFPSQLYDKLPWLFYDTVKYHAGQAIPANIKVTILQGMHFRVDLKAEYSQVLPLSEEGLKLMVALEGMLYRGVHAQAKRMKKVRKKLDNLFLKRVGIESGSVKGLRKNPVEKV